MKLFVMGESLYWNHEASHLHAHAIRVLVFSFIISLLFAAVLFFLPWLAGNFGLKQAWEQTGLMALVCAALMYAVIVVTYLLQEWSYRRTKALPPAERGFDIETRPTDRREAVRGRIPFAMDGPEQRDWERTRVGGIGAFVVRWFGIILVVDVSSLLFFSLLPDGVRLSLDYEWGEVAWIFGWFPLLGIVLGIGLWFLNEWSYRKGKGVQ